MSKIKSIIICATPLQAMIAERIVALHPDEEFRVIILTTPKSKLDKIKYYGDRLISKCHSGVIQEDIFARADMTKLRYIVQLVYLLLKFTLKFGFPDKVYVSSYDRVPVQILLSRLRGKPEVYTFDDGLVDLLPSTYRLSRTGTRRGIFNRLFLVPSGLQIRDWVVAHYSYLSGENTNHKCLRPVSLFSEFGAVGAEGKERYEELVCFLGQPAYEFCPNANQRGKEVTEAVVKDLGCSLYLPHPRESYHIDGVSYIDTLLIAEDYLLQDLEKHPNRCYTIYSYFSTTLMNLKDHPRIKAISCRPASVPERWNESYEFLERMGIEIREFPNI